MNVQPDLAGKHTKWQFGMNPENVKPYVKTLLILLEFGDSMLLS